VQFEHPPARAYETCITIIDTIILHIHTNDAYIFDTYTPTCAVRTPSVLVSYKTCITIIDTIVLHIYTNDAYICNSMTMTYDTYLCSSNTLRASALTIVSSSWCIDTRSPPSELPSGVGLEVDGSSSQRKVDVSLSPSFLSLSRRCAAGERTAW
jgi:hypothetical protein